MLRLDRVARKPQAFNAGLRLDLKDVHYHDGGEDDESRRARAEDGEADSKVSSRAV